MKPVKSLIILVLICLGFFLPKDSVYPLTEVAIDDIDEEIPLEGNPRSIAINPLTEQAVVTSVQPNKVSIVDLNTETVLSVISAGKMPLGVALDSGLNIALVTNSSENTISFIDLEKGQAVHKLSVGKKPLGVAINEVSHIGLVTNYMDNSVSIIDLQNRNVLKTISVGKRPIDVAVDSELNLALVVNTLGNSVSIIDLETYNETDQISVGKKPIAISINTETHLAAIANTSGHSATVINLQDGKITHIPVTKFPSDVAINSLDNRALIICDRGNKLAYLDLNTDTIIDYLEINKRSTGVAVNPFTNRAAVIDDKTDSVTLIQLPNPVSEISSLNPESVPRGSPATKIIVEGRGFLKTSTCSFLQSTSNPLNVNFVSNHYLEVTIPESLLAEPGTYHLVVTNPAPKGGESNAYEFIVGNPKPVISKLVPEETTAGGLGINLRVQGKGFFNNTIVYINDKPSSFTLINETEFQLYLTTQDLEAGTTLNISAFNPAPGGGQSNSLPFKVKNPLPSLIALSPSFITAGSPDFTLTLSGDNFVKSSKVLFNSQEFSPTSVVKNQINVTIPAAAVVTPGTYSVKVTNPPPGGGDSDTLPFVVRHRLAITGFSPAEGPVGTVVTINGTGFDAGGLSVRFNGAPAVVSNFTHSSITSSVPMGATSGPITVSTAYGAATTSSDFTVTPLYNFNLSVTPQNVKAAPGSDITYTASAAGNEGFSALISLSIQGLPDGFTGLFSPKTITSGQSSTLIITACDCTLSSPASMTIKGSATLEGKVVTRSAQVSLDLIQPGVTSLIGRVLDTERNPLRNVTILLGDSSAFTDESGNFLLENPPTGDQVILIDGSSASTETAKYPTIPITMTIIAGQTNSLPYVPHLHAQKHYNFTPINRTKETKAEDPEIPGLQLRIPAGVDIVGWDGEVNTKVSMTRVPIDALAVPPPPSEVQANSVMMFYFGKVGGGTPTVPIPITMPNDLGLRPGEKADLWYFDESPNLGEAPNEWRKAGTGTVSADGKTITTDPGVGIPRFCCGASLFAMQQAGEGTPINTPDSRTTGGEPVDLATGAFIHEVTDLTLQGRIPLTINRFYRTLDSIQGPFGFGTYFGYNWLLRRSGSMVTLILPGNSQIPFQLQPNGVYVNNSQPSFLGAKITYKYDGTATLRMKDGFSYKFDSNGLLHQQVDRNGNKVTLIRGFAQDVTKIIAPDGRAFDILIREGFPNLTRKITDPIGRTVEYIYSGGRLERVINPAGGETRYEYDGVGRMTAIIDPRGNAVVRNTYDANSRVCHQEQPDGATWDFYYITADQATTPRSLRLLSEAESGGPITRTSCSDPVSQSRVVSTIVVDPRGNPTTYRFNSRGMLIRTTNAIGQTTKYGRDLSTNLLTSYTDSLERATRFTYDNHGNLTSAIDPAGNVTSFQYEPTYNFLRKFTDALGNELDVKYDLHGNINKILNPLKDEITIQYDQYGQIISISDPLNNTATYTYDASGNLVEVIDPLGNKLTGDYDQASRLTAFTDTKGRTLRVTYNPSDRITHITNSVGKDTEFSYDLNRNLLSVKDANNRTVRTYTYDARNQLTTVTDQLGYTEIYRYNLNGNLISFTDRKEQPTEFVYDPLNRKIRTIYPDGTTTNYTYDSVGRLTTLDNSVSGPIEFVYTTFRCPTCPKTKLDTIIQEITRFGVTDYTYDELGRRKTMSVAGAPVMEYRYDAASRLVRITQEGMGNLDIDHDKADRMTSLTFSNGITTNFVFDQVNRLLNIRHSNMAGIVEDIVYAYDTTKERISFHTLNTQSQLPKEVTATYDSANRMLTFNDENLHYDVNGNLVEETEATGTITYVWNARDQLIGMHGPSLTASFKYDAAGRRIERNINGKTIQYLYDGLNIVAELENGSITASYVGGLRTDEIFARRDRSGIRYFLRDGLGSTIVLTDHNGTSKTTYSYAPYGNTLVTGEQTDNPFQYTGRENDGTGLYYYRMRYYSPELQRFISEDPLRLLGGINFYSYVANDPINLIDPYGFYALIDDAIFIAGGAVVGLAGQAFSDWLFGNSSGWEDYIAAAIGGAVGGEALLYTGPIGAGALGGAANNASKQLLRNLSGKQCGFNFVSLGLDTGIGALTGLIPTPRIQGITSGNNNYAAIFHQMVTKFQRGHISNLSFETALKMLIGRTFETSFVPGIGIGAIASGISSW